MPFFIAEPLLSKKVETLDVLPTWRTAAPIQWNPYKEPSPSLVLLVGGLGHGHRDGWEGRLCAGLPCTLLRGPGGPAS